MRFLQMAKVPDLNALVLLIIEHAQGHHCTFYALRDGVTKEIDESTIKFPCTVVLDLPEQVGHWVDFGVVEHGEVSGVARCVR